jgi:hypothetical protein
MLKELCKVANVSAEAALGCHVESAFQAALRSLKEYGFVGRTPFSTGDLSPELEARWYQLMRDTMNELNDRVSNPV